ncbi:MAG: hypothetical protein H7145_22820 [Akkermansiaceae bacterium]|nr:hypothetical protein [Armatimonadota bacterium]
MKTRTAALFCLAAIALPAITAFAQETPKATTAPTVDPNAVRRDLYDLVLLRSLQNVNLSEEQIIAMAKAVKEILDADKARRTKDDDAMREIAAEVKKARDGAVNGEPIPTEIETKFVEIQKTIVARVGSAKRESVEKILGVLWPTLTDAQKAEMDKQSIALYGGKRVPAAYRSKPKDAPREEVLKLAAGAFVENFLLDDRMPTLLASLKPLKTITKESGNTGPDSGASSKP